MSTIRKVEYYALEAPDRPGEGAGILETLHQNKINLLALTAYPIEGGSQVSLVPDKPPKLMKLAKQHGWKLSTKRSGFLAQGQDRAGVLVELTRKLGAAGINITAIDAVASGKNRYGAIFWVAAKDVKRAAKLIGAK